MTPGHIRHSLTCFALSFTVALPYQHAPCPRLPAAPRRLRRSCVRFAWSLSVALPHQHAPHRSFRVLWGNFATTPCALPEACRWHCHANARLVRGFRQPRGVTARVSVGLVGLPTPRQPWLPALRSGIRHWGRGPRRSGPKRLGCERCRVALTTPSPHEGFRSCSSPPAGEVSFHTRHGCLAFSFEQQPHVLTRLAAGAICSCGGTGSAACGGGCGAARGCGTGGLL